MPYITRTLIDEDAGPDEEYEFEVEFPATREKCDRCDGTGTHVNPAIDGNGLSEDSQSDPEFMADYMAGHYDVRCEECKGEKIVLVIDREAADPKMLKLLDEAEQAERECRAAEEAERRAGA
jgi:hypothetical protein